MHLIHFTIIATILIFFPYSGVSHDCDLGIRLDWEFREFFMFTSSWFVRFFLISCRILFAYITKPELGNSILVNLMYPERADESQDFLINGSHVSFWCVWVCSYWILRILSSVPYTETICHLCDKWFSVFATFKVFTQFHLRYIS